MNPDVRRVMFAGDWHGNTDWAVHCIALAGLERVDAIVQLGDFGIWPGVSGQRYLDVLEMALTVEGLTLYFLDGNHEDFPQLQAFPVGGDGLGVVRPHIRHLPRGHRWSWANLSFLALGGATSLDRDIRLEGRDWWPAEAITAAQAERAMAGGHADIMLTHDAPHDVEIPGLSAGWSPTALRAADRHRQLLSTVVDVVDPEFLLHGHFHSFHKTMRSNGTMVIGLGTDGEARNTMVWDLQDWRAP